MFLKDECPDTALYCGWYSLKNYIDSFDFVDGAVGYHIASYEAQNIHDPNNGQWCSSMLKNGITATLGAVDEPYLNRAGDVKSRPENQYGKKTGPTTPKNDAVLLELSKKS